MAEVRTLPPVGGAVAPAVRPEERALRQARMGALARHYLPQGHVLWPGNRCELLRDGVEAFPEMVNAIRAARSYVRVAMYMFRDDSVGRLFARELADAARRGVEVRVMYDAIGSFGTPRAFFAAMRAAGVDVRPFRPLSFRSLRRLVQRDHRKLVVVDGEVAFTGGINLGAMWAPRDHGPDGRGWRDDVLKVEGPAVWQLERSFAAGWRMHLLGRLGRLRELMAVRQVRRRGARGEVALAVLTSRRSIYRAYLHAISRARRSIQIAAAYFVPDKRMVRALQEAARRGVRVELILNARWDHPLLHHVTRAYYERLLEAGIQIHEWCHGILHAKTAVVDGVWGTIGSFNLERLSFRLNHEANVAFAHPPLARTLEASFAADRALCTPLSLDAWRRRPMWQKLIERLLFLFRKLV